MTAFRAELEDCLPDLWRYAYALTRNRADADDLVQDCAERALLKQRLRLPGRALRPWLTTMMLNIFRNRHRRGGARRMVPLDDEALLPPVAPAAEARLELGEMLARVARLPDGQRDVLLSVVIAGLSYDETARALGIPRGTVMSRLARARAQLRSDEPPKVTQLRSVT